MKITKGIFIFLCAVFIKQVLWTIAIPIWQTPDEQAHFAQLQWYAENKNISISGENNLSSEVAISEKLLGTYRDNQGNNKFTYHPDFKIDYSRTSYGPHELEIANLSAQTRTTYVGREAAMYPPLYYQLSVPLYDLVYNNSLIDRIYLARLLPGILGLMLFIVTYLVGREIWSEKLYALTLAILVSFQPMISFVTAGIHPDNLLNLLYSVGLLLCLKILKNGIKLKYLILLAITLYPGFQTKQLVYFIIPVIVAVITYKLFVGKLIGLLLCFLILISPVIAFIFQIPIPYMTNVTQASPLWTMDFWQYLKFRIPRLLFEMWPWFWGVFKWLSLTLPPAVLKIITRIALLSGLGLIIYMFSVLKKSKSKNGFEFTSVTFALFSILSYVLYLFFWDWRLMQALGFSQGLQGRYLFTNIIPVMLLIMVGIKTVFSLIKKEKTGMVSLIVGMILLNAISLYVVANSFYDLSTLSTFALQASQYKPGLIKLILSPLI